MFAEKPRHAIALLTVVSILVAVGTHAQASDDDTAYMKREHSLVKPYHGECTFRFHPRAVGGAVVHLRVCCI